MHHELGLYREAEKGFLTHSKQQFSAKIYPMHAGYIFCLNGEHKRAPACRTGVFLSVNIIGDELLLNLYR